MAQSFTQAEWQTINDFLDQGSNARDYGIPDRRDGSLVIASWNIRKLGALRNNDGSLKKSAGATAMLARFCQQCDLVAIQEVQDDTEALFDLRDRMNAAGAGDPFEIIMSDVTGRVPGYAGMAERSAFIYNTDKVGLGRVASDLSLDRTAVLANIRDAYSTALAAELPQEDQPGFIDQAIKWITDIPRIANIRFNTFVQFIRSPHLVEFVVEGTHGRYEIHCVNAHLVSGRNKTERANEFFALLEWLLLQSPKTVVEGGKVVMILADLNLDFESSVDKRRRGIEKYVKTLNEKRGMDAKVNFPFLDGGFFTNARGDETFDHIAYIADDTRWPRGRHNDLGGTLGPDQFAYGMFNFTKAFVDAGPGRLADGKPDFDRFSHDFTDHMPIWLRMPMPSDDQHQFTV